jgi:hypothetical protein
MRLFLAALALIFATAALADTHVKGYYKKNGTYVEPHYRSSPNSTINDNYSTKGNVNPYTGKEGTRNPNDGGTYSQPVILPPSNPIAEGDSMRLEEISPTIPLENQQWLNQSCPKVLGPSLWKSCMKRESAALNSGMPTIESMSQENQQWLNQSCPKVLGPSLWKSCMKRESAALR